jgi:hypothetical protein
LNFFFIINLPETTLQIFKHLTLRSQSIKQHQITSKKIMSYPQTDYSVVADKVADSIPKYVCDEDLVQAVEAKLSMCNPQQMLNAIIQILPFELNASIIEILAPHIADRIKLERNATTIHEELLSMEEDMHAQNVEVSAALPRAEPNITSDDVVEGDVVVKLEQYESKEEVLPVKSAWLYPELVRSNATRDLGCAKEEAPPVKSAWEKPKLVRSNATRDLRCAKEEAPPVKSTWEKPKLVRSNATRDLRCAKEEAPPVKSTWKQPIKTNIKTEKKVLTTETTWKVVSNHSKSEPKQPTLTTGSLNKKPDRLNTVTSLKWFFFKDTKKGPILPKSSDWFLWDARNIAEETEKPILIPIGWQRVEGLPWTYRVNDKSQFIHYLNESMEWEHYEVFDNNTSKRVSNEYLRYAQTPVSKRYNMIMPAN